ncbi:MAG: 3-dehydroquinate synthase family protein [Acidimicrobiales bacterium]
MITVPVRLGERSYDVVVGAGARHRLAEVLPAGARRAAVVSQEAVGWAPALVDGLRGWAREPSIDTCHFYIGEGEDAKALSTVEELCRGFARFGLTRADVVVAVGGGVVTDVAGFAAACWHRGVAVVHVATTLLAQVDAAIGGKCGVNLPEGKNLVGAFWQPAAVLCDTEVLTTLPPAEHRSGLGEMAKYAFLGVEGLDDVALALPERVARCVALKAAVVAADEREGAGGRRALLNYGHTLAHALEAAGWAGAVGVGGGAGAAGVPAPAGAGPPPLRHGEAVAVGLVFAARLARRLHRIGDDRVGVHERLVDGYGLPSRLPEGADPERLAALMGRDKKARDGLTFVLDGPGGLEVVEGVSRAEVLGALAEVAG